MIIINVYLATSLSKTRSNGDDDDDDDHEKQSFDISNDSFCFKFILETKKKIESVFCVSCH